MAKRMPVRAAVAETRTSTKPRTSSPSSSPRSKMTGPRQPQAAVIVPSPIASVARAVAERPLREALAEFEAALRSMQQHEYQKAAARFRSLLTSFPAERPLMDRVRVYLDLCERELRRKPAPPETIEERLTSATAALNNGDEQTAEKLVKAVLKESPDHDLALYLLAAVRARLGDPGGALDLLRKAVQISPDISAQARHDADFEPLRRFAGFQQLLEHNGHNGHSNGRKTRRSTAR